MSEKTVHFNMQDVLGAGQQSQSLEMLDVILQVCYHLMVGQVKCVKLACSEAAEAIDKVHFHLSSSKHLYINLINVNRINLNLSVLIFQFYGIPNIVP